MFPGTTALIAANVAMFFLESVAPGLVYLLALSLGALRWAQASVSARGCLSATPSCMVACCNLAFIMYALYLFGGAIEHVFGGRRLLTYYFVCVVFRRDHAARIRRRYGRVLSDCRRFRRRVWPIAGLREVLPKQSRHADLLTDSDAGADVRCDLRGVGAVSRRHRLAGRHRALRPSWWHDRRLRCALWRGCTIDCLLY